MRFKAIKISFFVIIFLIILRLGYWQIVRSDDLVSKAEEQRLTTREIEAPRGSIFFSDQSALAAVQPTFLVYAEPQVIKSTAEKDKKDLDSFRKDFASKMAAIFYEDDLMKRPEIRKEEESSPSAEVAVEVSPSPTPNPEQVKEQKITDLETFIRNQISKNLYWVSLGRKVDVKVKEKIDKLDLPGIGFEKSSSRFYPEGSSSAHLLGFVGYDVYGKETGYFGVEGFYNGELKGKNGEYTQEKDALGLPILIGKFTQREAKPGKNLTLSIDRAVQYIVEDKLKKGIEKYKAKSGSVIVMDPKTGEVLAMASWPSYDPSRILDYPKDNFRNPIVADGYEPGSTFKVLVMAAGINEGLVTPQTVCDICAGPLNIGGFTIRTWNNQYNAQGTMTDVLIHSDNTGMVFVSKKLGFEKLYSYITGFGFGAPTGIDLQDEQSPDLRPKKDWKEIDEATASFGQGISVTALQVVRAVSALANGGKLMEPHMVTEVKDGDKIDKIEPKVMGQPIKEETAKQITEMMVRAVDEGESKFAKPKGYRIAGKTGTAQIPVAGHYDANKTVASFVGFAPADDPKFVMLVRYTEPGSSIYGAETAAPTFFEIARELFTYYGIAPTGQ